MTNKLLLPTAIVMILTVIVKLFAAFKEVFIAHQFGISDDLDAFFIAYLYTSFMMTIFSGIFGSAIIPTYIKINERGSEKEQNQLLSDLMTSAVIFLSCVVLLLWVIKPICVPLLGSGFSSDKLESTLSLTTILLPISAISGLSTILSAVLHAHRRFFVATLTPVSISVLIVVAIWLFRNQIGVSAIAIGTLTGHLAELVILGYWITRQGLSIRIRFQKFGDALWKILRQSGPLFISVLMTTGMGIVDQAMAAMLRPGSVSALNYGYRLVGIIFTLCASIWTVALPHFSSMVNQENYWELKHAIRNYCKIVCVITVLFTGILVVASPFIVQFVFERGAFSAADSAIVTRIQQLYLLHLPFFVLTALIMRFFSALNLNTLLCWGGIIGFCLNWLFNLVFIHFFDVAGIALATSVVSVFSLSYLLWFMNIRLKNLPGVGE